jgi:UDP-sulfoquinovose synthase
MLNILDTLACVELALLNPPNAGEYRVFNQFTESWSVSEMAELVTGALPGKHSIEHLVDPRTEAEEHYYRAAHTKLLDLGLVPHLLNDEVIGSIAELVAKHRDRIDPRVIRPAVQWRPTRPPSHPTSVAADGSPARRESVR